MPDKPAPKQEMQARGFKSQKASFRGRLTASASGIHNDDAGIFVTCDKGLEAKCLREMDDILSEYVHSHPDGQLEEDGAKTISDVDDIEGAITKELESMKSSSISHEKPFHSVKLDIACVSFIRVPAPFDPVDVVRRVCENAHSNTSRPRSRYVRRLTPVSCMRKTLGNGLEQLCGTVLTPIFGQGDVEHKFAIRPTIRNNDRLNRDSVIKTVADAVGRLSSRHSVDLKDYDRLILVEVYRNVCGMSVVGQEFEKLRRFNLSEIYQAANRRGFVRQSNLT